MNRIARTVVPVALVSAGLVLGSSTTVSAATALTPDPTFGGGDGVVTVPSTSEFDWGHTGTVDHLGRTLIMSIETRDGDEDTFDLVRLKADGSIDGDFGTDGRVTLPDDFLAFDVAANEHGIAVSGSVTAESDNADEPIVVRLLEDGSYDDRFGDEGVLTRPDPAPDHRGGWVGLGPDGSLTVMIEQHVSGDTWEQRLERYELGGSTDAGFGGDGVVVPGDVVAMSNVLDLEIDAQGRTWLLGFSPATVHEHVARLTPSGEADPTYGTSGVGSTPLVANPTNLDVGADGTAVIGGRYTEVHAVVQRLNPSGSLDTRFAHGVVPVPGLVGRVEAAILDTGHVAVRSDGRVDLLDPAGAIVASSTWDASPEDEDRLSFSDTWASAGGRLVAASIEPPGDEGDPGLMTVRRFVVDAPSFAPSVASVEAYDGSLSVTWNAPEEAVKPIRAYHVIALDDEGDIAGQQIVAADIRQTSLEGIDETADHEVVVGAFDEFGTLPASALFAVDGTGDAEDPGSATAVRDLAVTSGQGFVTATWNPPTDDGGAAIAGYSVFALRASDDSLGNWRNVRADVRTVSLDDLTNGVAYDVYVVAVTSEGFGDVAAPVVATPSASGAAPLPPEMSWVSLVRVNGGAVVTWGPPVERGEPVTSVNVVTINHGFVFGWYVANPLERQTFSPVNGFGSVYVVPIGTTAWGPTVGPIAGGH